MVITWLFEQKTTRSSTAAAGSEESLNFKEDEAAGEEVQLEQMEDDVDDVDDVDDEEVREDLWTMWMM